MIKDFCPKGNNEAYHYIYNKIVNRQKIFYDDFDRYYFIKLCRQAKEKFGIKIHGFCLTNNQYHLLIQTNLINLSKTTSYIEDRYEKYFTQKYQVQKKSSLKLLSQNEIQWDIEKTLDHIHLKAVNEELCEHLKYFRWSSYLSYKNDHDYFDLLNLKELKKYFQEYLHMQKTTHSKINTVINSKEMKAHLREYKVDYSTYRKLFTYCLLEWTELDSIDLENELHMQASSIRELKNNLKFDIEDNNQLLDSLIYSVRKNFGLF